MAAAKHRCRGVPRGLPAGNPEQRTQHWLIQILLSPVLLASAQIAVGESALLADAQGPPGCQERGVVQSRLELLECLCHVADIQSVALPPYHTRCVTVISRARGYHLVKNEVFRTAQASLEPWLDCRGHRSV